MHVEVNDQKFGWGHDVQDLPSDSNAYGPHVLSARDAEALTKAITATGEWVAFSKVRLEQRQVFLFKPGLWRRRLELAEQPGQILQVREKAAGLRPPRV